jgi:hypothetical protein
MKISIFKLNLETYVIPPKLSTLRSTYIIQYTDEKCLKSQTSMTQNTISHSSYKDLLPPKIEFPSSNCVYFLNSLNDKSLIL